MRNEQKDFYEVEVGLSGTGLATAIWKLNADDESSVRAIINILIKGSFDTPENDEPSQRYIKLRGQDGYLQWASKKISSERPDVYNVPFSKPFTEE